MTKRTLAHALRTRDEKGVPHTMPITREYAKYLLSLTCVMAVRRGMGGERYLRTASGLVVVLDMLTPRQRRMNGI